ncbi:MAG: T9SS type B sorting domain-containing protein, partial [Bacteroidota bacterium]
PDNIICASNEEGDLLFYSDGHTFRNRLHEDMLNSPTNEYALWYSQAAVARDPGNPDRYYVFVSILDGVDGQLTYTIVDMSLDNGLGGLDPNNTHVIMLNDVGQHMTTTRHANGKDTWLICIREGRYHSYLITENGISTTPEMSTEGVSFFDGPPADFGLMQISPDNKLIAAAFPVLRKLFLLEFNDSTGRLKLVYEEEEPDESLGAFSAVEFSPNSKVLYTAYNNVGIQQYDISDINNIPPRIDIAEGSNYPYFKLGPDGKIYSIQSGEPFIGAIQNPNIIGQGCNYDENVLFLSATNLVDLPTFLLPKFPEGVSYINICQGETTEFNYSAPVRDVTYTWDLGDGNTVVGDDISYLYANPGTYTVSVEAFDNENNTIAFTDTTEITIYASPIISEPEDVFQCAEDTTVFFSNFNEEILNGQDPDIFSVKYFFSESDARLRSNDELEFIPEIGTKTIWVRVENRFSPGCYAIENFDIITPDFISIDIEQEYYICDEREGVTLTAPDGFISYAWSNGEDTQSTTVYFPGIYTLTVEKDFGDFICSTQTNVTVIAGSDALPEIEEIRVIDWSQNHNTIEVILSQNGSYEFSVDGINYQESPIISGLPIDDYYVYVRDARCFQEIKSDKLFLLYYKKFFTPNNDGVNDYWQIINAYTEENIDITIYDRYGKLLYNMNYTDRGWDGTHNGMDMPTNDYWFRVVRESGKVHHGHFTLKR